MISSTLRAVCALILSVAMLSCAGSPGRAALDCAAMGMTADGAPTKERSTQGSAQASACAAQCLVDLARREAPLAETAWVAAEHRPTSTALPRGLAPPPSIPPPRSLSG